jgi:membrane protein DedA with SNARE-associated domain
MTDGLIAQYGYFGIILLLVLGGLGVPIPEEAPIVLSAILSHKGAMHWLPALGACFTGVLVGDFVVYFLGYFYGEKVLSFRLTRQFLTRAREEQIKGYFHRHGIKILIVGRFAVGFRTAAYLTAGILRLPFLRLLLADLFAASLSTLLMFGLGYWFADWVEAGLRELKHYLVVIVFLIVIGWVGYSYYKARKRRGRVVGPPVLVEADSVPLPQDDLETGVGAETRPSGGATPTPQPSAPPTPQPALPRPEARVAAATPIVAHVPIEAEAMASTTTDTQAPEARA